MKGIRDRKWGMMYLLVLRSHGRRIVILGRRAHGNVGLHRCRRHVGSIRHRWNESGTSSRLGRVGIPHVSRLRLKGGRHATTLARAVSKLVVGRVSHLVVVLVVVRVESSTAATLGREVCAVLALDGVARLASIMGAGLRAHCIWVGRDRTLSHVALFRF
jgi:hypothetical protein